MIKKKLYREINKKMNNEELLAKIYKLKDRVKEIVSNIQALKSKLEREEIPPEDFRDRKSILEDELRKILHNISLVKEKVQIQDLPKVKEKDQVIQSEKDVKLSISQQIYKEVQIAIEAKELMYFFQCDFEGSITKAKVYLSITLEKHFIIGVDFTSYPQKPKLDAPSPIQELFGGEENFLHNISSYVKWDINNPNRIYQLVTEIETVLINKFSADMDTILKKSVEFVDQVKKRLNKAILEAQAEIHMKNFDKAIELHYLIVDLAYDIQDYEKAKIYTHQLNILLKKAADIKKEEKKNSD